VGRLAGVAAPRTPQSSISTVPVASS
jgi:hypothetical protein